MPGFIYDLPRETLAFAFCAFALIGMLVGMLLFKPMMRLLIGSGSDLNESVNYATGGFNLFYGLLLGLLTVSAYQNNDNVRQALLNESTALSILYADMDVYSEPTRSDMKAMMRDYVLFTIHKDWDAHRRGTYLDGGENRSNAMRLRLTAYEPKTRGQEIVHTEVLGAYQRFVEARQNRISSVFVRIPTVLWQAVGSGAIITVLLICLLRMRPARQFFLGTVSALFLAVILFVIVTLDSPLRGKYGLPPGALQIVWDRTMAIDESRY